MAEAGQKKCTDAAIGACKGNYGDEFTKCGITANNAQEACSDKLATDIAACESSNKAIMADCTASITKDIDACKTGLLDCTSCEYTKAGETSDNLAEMIYNFSHTNAQGNFIWTQNTLLDPINDLLQTQLTAQLTSVVSELLTKNLPLIPGRFCMPAISKQQEDGCPSPSNFMFTNPLNVP